MEQPRYRQKVDQGVNGEIERKANWMNKIYTVGKSGNGEKAGEEF